MADVFVSYKREDQEQKGRVIPIVRALEAEGFDVFYDVEIPPGSTWEQVLQSKINQSKCVIVLWSQASVDSDWVKEEAEIAKNAGKIIPVFLDPVNAPFGFSRIEGANLIGWNGDLANREWQNLVSAVRNRVGEGTGHRQPEVTSVPMPIDRRKGGFAGGGAGKFALIALIIALLGGVGFVGFQMIKRPEATQTRPQLDSDKMKEKLAFDEAWNDGSKVALLRFLKQYPTSAYVKRVKERIAEIDAKERLHDDSPTVGVIEDVVEVPRRPLNTGRLNEDCISVSGNVSIEAMDHNRGYMLVDARGSALLSASGRDAKDEIAATRTAVTWYKLTQQCFVGRPDAEFSYWKTSSGDIPSGRVADEDCIAIDRNDLSVKERGGMSYVFDGNASLFRMESTEDAKTVISVIDAYEASHVCYLKRPDPAMTYLRK